MPGREYARALIGQVPRRGVWDVKVKAIFRAGRPRGRRRDERIDRPAGTSAFFRRHPVVEGLLDECQSVYLGIPELFDCWRGTARVGVGFAIGCKAGGPRFAGLRHDLGNLGSAVPFKEAFDDGDRFFGIITTVSAR